MKTIYKYKVNVLDDTIVEGRISRFLSVQIQDSTESVCVWAEIDVNLPVRKFIIMSYGTGHRMVIDDSAEYIGTVQLFSGQLVAHYYAQLFDNSHYEMEDELTIDASL